MYSYFHAVDCLVYWSTDKEFCVIVCFSITCFLVGQFYFLIKPVNYLAPSISFKGAEEAIAFQGLPFYKFSNPLCTFAWTPWAVWQPVERPFLYETTRK